MVAVGDPVKAISLLGGEPAFVGHRG
jgi:DNA-binding protein HU-beta